MRILEVTDKFVSRQTRSGCYMHSKWDSETDTQKLVYRNGNPIADIYDFKDSKNFRLRLYPKQRYCGRTEHINRLHSVLRSVQMQDTPTNWDMFRYSAHINYQLKVHDRKLSAEYPIEDQRTLEFQFTDGRLVLDYVHLENQAFPNATPTPVVALDTNSNLRTVSSRLTTILQGV